MFKATTAIVRKKKQFQREKQPLDVDVKDQENPCKNDSWSSTMSLKIGRPCAFESIRG